jgi:hypothetical protein
MKLNFKKYRNRQIRIQNGYLEIGNRRLQFADVLNCGDTLSEISAYSIAQAADPYIRLSNGYCHPQLAVVIFAVTGVYRTLDFYFPIIKMLSESEIDSFYQFANSIAQNANFDLRLIDQNRTDFTDQIPSGSKYLVAGHIAEVFYYQRNILGHFLATPRHIQIYTNQLAFEQDGGVAGGDYNPQRESIQLVMTRLFEGFLGEMPGVCPFLHELGHMLDHFDVSSGKMGRSEGLLPGLSSEDGTVFNSRARHLFVTGKRLELKRYIARCQGKSKLTDKLPIGHPYVFQNDGEFIAGYFEMFFRNPNYFADQNQDLYLAFVELFGYDPRNAWKRDFPFYVNENRRFYRSRERPRKPNLSVPSQ